MRKIFWNMHKSLTLKHETCKIDTILIFWHNLRKVFQILNVVFFLILAHNCAQHVMKVNSYRTKRSLIEGLAGHDMTS